MREIKFRIWDKRVNFLGEPVGLLYMLKDAKNIIDYDDLIFMEYTDLKDCNGKEICEGDIVKLYHEEGDPFPTIEFIGKVTYKNAAFKLTDPSCEYPYDLGIFDTEAETEVIGNIYENPELLEENNDAS